MTAGFAPVTARPVRTFGQPALAVGRLLRLELRRSAMLWLIPVAIIIFWYNCYRETMALPAIWNLRAMNMQASLLLDFVPPVAGAAAWMGSRDARRKLTDLIGVSAGPRWTRQIITWAATVIWALAAYIGCVAVVYLVTARQAHWGGPLWWPGRGLRGRRGRHDRAGQQADRGRVSA